MDKKKVTVLLIAVLVTASAVSALVTYKLTKGRTKNDIYISEEEYSDIMSYFELDEIDQALKTYSVNGADHGAVLEGAKSGMVTSLKDGYSAYYPGSLFRLLGSGADGSSISQGMMLVKNQNTGYLEVIKLFADSPAANAGINEKDAISKIDGMRTELMTVEEGVLRLMGQDGTKVTVTVNNGEEHDIAITRKTEQYQVVFTDMVSDRTGMIKVFEFSQNSASQLRAAVEALKKEDVKDIVIDLRNCSGGFVSQAADAADLFIDAGLMAQAKGKDEKTWNAKTGVLFDGDIVIITDGGTSGVAEVFTAALHDNGAARTVGTKTAGKAPYFSYVDLQNSSDGLKLVSAWFYTPKGELIEGNGLQPDFLKSSPTRSGTIEDDEQLQAALQILD